MTPYYKDGSVTLYHGNALELLPTLGKVNSIVTDPPYNVRDDEEWDDKSEVEMARFCMEWATMAHRATTELVTFDSGYSPLRRICEMLWPRVRVMVWDKPAGSQYAGSSERGMWYAHEPIYHCYAPSLEKCMGVGEAIRLARETVKLSRGGVDMALRGKKTGLCFRWEEGACLPTPDQVKKLKGLLPLNGDFDALLKTAYGRRTVTAAEGRDVLSHRTVSGAMHSCQKPLGLMRELVERLTAPGDLVADIFAGSGTTLLACKELGRRAIGVELEEKNCEMTARRLAQEQLPLSSANVKAEARESASVASSVLMGANNGGSK
jgi:site-specific DNA-methyltransferase (adenine-specific)